MNQPPTNIGIPMDSPKVHQDFYREEKKDSPVDPYIATNPNRNKIFLSLPAAEPDLCSANTLHVISKTGGMFVSSQHNAKLPNSLSNNFFIVKKKYNLAPNDLIALTQQIVAHVKNAGKNQVVFSSLLFDINVFHFRKKIVDKKDVLSRFNLPSNTQSNIVVDYIKTVYEKVSPFLSNEKHLEVVYLESLESKSYYTKPHTTRSVHLIEKLVFKCDEVLKSCFTKLKHVLFNCTSFNVTTSDTILVMLAHLSRNLCDELENLYSARTGIVYLHGYYVYQEWFKSEIAAQSLLITFALINCSAIAYFMHNVCSIDLMNLALFNKCKSHLKISYLQSHRYVGKEGFRFEINTDCVHWLRNNKLYPLPPHLIDQYEKRYNIQTIPSLMDLSPVPTVCTNTTVPVTIPAANVAVSVAPHSSFAVSHVTSAPYVATSNSISHSQINVPPQQNVPLYNQQIYQPQQMVISGPYVTSTAEQSQTLTSPYHYIQPLEQVAGLSFVNPSETIAGHSYVNLEEDTEMVENKVLSVNTEPTIQDFLANKFDDLSNQLMTKVSNISFSCTLPDNEKQQLECEKQTLENTIQSLKEEIENLRVQNQTLSELENDLHVARQEISKQNDQNSTLELVQKELDQLKYDRDQDEKFKTRIMRKLNVKSSTDILPEITSLQEKYEESLTNYTMKDNQYTHSLERIKNIADDNKNLEIKVETIQNTLNDKEQTLNATTRLLNICQKYMPANYNIMSHAFDIENPENEIFRECEDTGFQSCKENADAALSVVKDITITLNNTLNDPEFGKKTDSEQAADFVNLMTNILNNQIITKEISDEKGFIQAIQHFLSITVAGPTPAGAAMTNKKRKAHN